MGESLFCDEAVAVRAVHVLLDDGLEFALHGGLLGNFSHEYQAYGKGFDQCLTVQFLREDVVVLKVVGDASYEVDNGSDEQFAHQCLPCWQRRRHHSMLYVLRYFILTKFPLKRCKTTQNMYKIGGSLGKNEKFGFMI